MKKVLCYGDSNTYGFIPNSFSRYKKDERWSGILSSLLPEYEILEEGMNNRTVFFKNPEGLKQSGGEYLPIYLQNHKDIDIFILSLGTNDAQIFYDLNENIIREKLTEIIKLIHETNLRTEIIIVPPVKIGMNILNSGFSMMFDKNSIMKNRETFYLFEEIAKENGCEYFDFNKYAKPSDIDGLHYIPESHKIIAENLAEFIKTISVLPKLS